MRPLSRDADPVVEVRTVTTRVCPAELLEAPSAKPARPAGGSLTGDRPTLDWIGQLSRWADDLLARFADAAAQCS